MWNIGYTPFDEIILQRDFTPEDAIRSLYDIKRWQAHAISLDSSFVQHFRQLAKKLNMAIAIGI